MSRSNKSRSALHLSTVAHVGATLTSQSRKAIEEVFPRATVVVIPRGSKNHRARQSILQCDETGFALLEMSHRTRANWNRRYMLFCIDGHLDVELMQGMLLAFKQEQEALAGTVLTTLKKSYGFTPSMAFVT